MINWLRNNKRKAGGAAAAVALATTLVAGLEGYVPYVYHDSVGVATYCYGETQNPRPGHHYTKQECTAQLKKRVAEFDAAVRSCIRVPLPAKSEAAFTSTAYNIGKGAFCSSSMVRLANAGRLTAACDFLSHYNRAGGHVLRGLTVRRGKERELCLEGAQEGR